MGVQCGKFMRLWKWVLISAAFLHPPLHIAIMRGSVITKIKSVSTWRTKPFCANWEDKRLPFHRMQYDEAEAAEASDVITRTNPFKCCSQGATALTEFNSFRLSENDRKIWGEKLRCSSVHSSGSNYCRWCKREWIGSALATRICLITREIRMM